MEWAAFERVSGPLLVHERIDMAAALVAFVIARSHGAKSQFKDFLMDWDRRPPSEEQNAAMLGMALEAAASQPSARSS